MPGSGFCARCRASLQLATTVIDVHPPRARFGSTFQNGFLPFRRFGNRLRESLRSLIPEEVVPAVTIRPSTWWRLLLPGWVHLAQGNSRVGWPLFFGYLFALVTGTVLFGTTVGAVLWGIAFTAHVVSIQDGLFSGWRSLYHRIGGGALIAVLLFSVLYRPAFREWNRYVAAVRVVESLGDFQPGDVLWYQPNRRPHLGEWIYFQQVPQNIGAGRNVQWVLQGPWFGRVIALGGQPVAATPTSDVPEDGPFPTLPSLVVPTGYVAILPHTKYSGRTIPPPVQAAMALVARDRIEGVLLRRIYPFTRIRRY